MNAPAGIVRLFVALGFYLLLVTGCGANALSQIRLQVYPKVARVELPVTASRQIMLDEADSLVDSVIRK